MDQTPEQPIPIKKGVGLKLQTIIDNRFNVEGAAAKKPIPFSEIERRGKTDAVRDLNIALLENRSTTANEEVKDAKEKSRTDKLTGLLNRHGMDEDTERVIALNKRRGSKAKMSIVNLDMIDLNVFNNTLGHEAGDHALVQLADAINARKRVTDIAGRTGGDEFEVILPDTDEQQALVLSEGLKEELNQRNVNASIGVAEIDYSTPEMLRESKHLADLAMYKAKASFKQTGVNEIVASTSLTEEDIMKPDELKKLAEARTAKRLEPVSLENVA